MHPVGDTISQARDEHGLLRITLLSGFEIALDGVGVRGRWRLRKAKTLVKILALAPGHRSHREVLMDQLWPDLDTAAAANNFHQALHAARQVLGSSRLALSDDVVVLGPSGDVIVDVDEFTAVATAIRSTATVDELKETLALWRGELLPEDLYEDWTTPHREHLGRLRVELAGRLAQALIEEGRASEAVALLEGLAGNVRWTSRSIDRSSPH